MNVFNNLLSALEELTRIATSGNDALQAVSVLDEFTSSLLDSIPVPAGP